MSQRNPMNERYTTDKHTGTTRKSAASAKPKSKAAASVSMGSTKKSPKDRKAEEKARRKEETARQRELDRKYYKPDTERFKKLRKIWWVSLACAVVFTAASFLLRDIGPDWISIVCLILAYASIIFAFYIDFSKIRKERRAYQTRMYALELEEKKKEEQAMREAARKDRGKGGRKGAQAKKESASAAAPETPAESASDVPESPKGLASGFMAKLGLKKTAATDTGNAEAS